MMPEIAIWRAASLMLKRYGEKALDESTARADELFAEQDDNGARGMAPDHRPPTRRCLAGSTDHLEFHSAAGSTPPASPKPPALFLITDSIESAAATADRRSPSLGARPMKRRRWRSPPR
jgi:hypothetical protein